VKVKVTGCPGVAVLAMRKEGQMNSSMRTSMRTGLGDPEG
jgi:hypothetical protein